jgi:hypothetical protein
MFFKFYIIISIFFLYHSYVSIFERPKISIILTILIYQQNKISYPNHTQGEACGA